MSTKRIEEKKKIIFPSLLSFYLLYAAAMASLSDEDEKYTFF